MSPSGKLGSSVLITHGFAPDTVLDCRSLWAAGLYIQLELSDLAGSGTLPKLWTSLMAFLKLQGGALFSESLFLFFMI